MSNATWQIVSKKESHWEIVSKQMSEQEIFMLLVTAESEPRPGTIYQWRGKIEIDESGGQHLKNMSLDGSRNVDRPNDSSNIGINKWIPHEEDPAAAFEEIARICDEDTQEAERGIVKREEKNRQDRASVSATTLSLQQLAAEGLHP